MKSASSALLALLAGDSFTMADLYTITCLDGTVLRYTTAGVPVTYGGNLFHADQLLLDGFKYKLAIGSTADAMDVVATVPPGSLAGSIGVFTRILNGGFDGARLRVERLFSASPADPSAGTVELFTGRISAITDIGRTKATLQVKSDLELLDLQMPKNTFQPGCIHTLYDAGCGKLKSDFGFAGSVAAGSTVSNLMLAGSPPTSTVFDGGTLTFSSGPNAGTSRTIRALVSGVMALGYPLEHAPVAGDAFTAYYGCDKTRATCSGTFANLANWRAFPYIPTPETAY